jgi:hypothetical protein
MGKVGKEKLKLDDKKTLAGSHTIIDAIYSIVKEP